MIDPYRMVFVNLIASCLVLLGIIIYKFVYPKKKINLFILLLFISILPIISTFRAGDYESGDFNIHIYRIMSFYDSLKEGILMPSWAAELNATYGNPLFIFNYSLPYYFISLFHFIGISFIESMKLYLGLTLYLSGIFMYMWAKEILGNKLAAFASAIFYIFSPYHLIDVHFRATLGESTIFTIIPLLFYFIAKYFKEKKVASIIPVILFTGLLFLAHPLLASVFFAVETIYILFNSVLIKNIKLFIFGTAALIIGIFSTAYTWFAFLLYSPYMYKEIIPVTQPVPLFYPFNQIFYSPWRHGLLFQGPNGELALIIGYAQMFVLVVSVIMILAKKVPKKILAHYIFWIILWLFLIFLMHPTSRILWKHIYTFGGMLTLYGRLSLATSFCTSIIAGYFILTLLNIKTRRIYIYILLTITIGSTILNWGHRRVIPEINDAVLRKNVWKSTATEGPSYFANTKWADKRGFWFDKRPLNSLDILEGKGVIKQIERTSTKHLYLISAETTILIRENTLYFPGWSLKSNGKKLDIYPDRKGVINAKLPKGLQYIEVFYQDLPLYKLFKKIFIVWSLIVMSALLYYGVGNLRLKLKKFGYEQM